MKYNYHTWKTITKNPENIAFRKILHLQKGDKLIRLDTGELAEFEKYISDNNAPYNVFIFKGFNVAQNIMYDFFGNDGTKFMVVTGGEND